MAASQNVVHRVTVSASPENLLGKQIFGPHLSPTKSEMLRVGTSNLCFNKSPAGFLCRLYSIKASVFF